MIIRCQEEMSKQVESIQPHEDSRLIIQKFKVMMRLCDYDDYIHDDDDGDGHDDHDDGHDPFLQTGNVPPGDFPFEELPGSTPVTNGHFDYH